MINLKVSNGEEDFFLRIEKNNCVLVENETGIMRLYLWLYKIICEKNSSFSGCFDFKTINSKDFVLLNLLDYTVFSESFQFKKGTLLFYYIESLLKSSVDYFDTSIYDKISNFLNQILDDSGLEIEYQVEEDFLKIILSICNFSVSSKCLPFENMKQLLNRIFCTELNKKYIIFYNSRIFDFDFSKYDCCYSFDVNFGCSLQRYNLISFSDRVQELNLEVLMREVKLLWPISYEECQIVENIRKYFEQFLFLDELHLNFTDEVITAHIIQKLFHFNKHLIYDSSLLSDNIKSFLTKF